MDSSAGGDVISCGRGLWVMRSSARVVHIPHKFEHPVMLPVVGILRRYKIGVALSGRTKSDGNPSSCFHLLVMTLWPVMMSSILK
jgi:hypothetical protein